MGREAYRWIVVLYTKFSVDIKENILKRSIGGTGPSCQLACDVKADRIMIGRYRENRET